MRPGQNKRMRGRNNTSGGNTGGNRKGPNPLTRSYESNGPDVKVRGTAHHIGEKYLQLARDAQSSGDPVMAESYLQHAEHYFRLIAAAQQAQQQSAHGYQRTAGEQAEADEDDGDDDFGSLPDRFASPAERVVTPPPQPAPQPYAERQPYNGGERPAYEPRQDRGERYDRQAQDRQPQDRQPSNGERPSYQDRQQPDRNEHARYDNRQDRGERTDGQRQDGQRYDNRNGRADRPAYGERSFADRNNGQQGQDRGQDRGNGQERSYPDRSQNRDFDNRGNRNGNRGQREFRTEQPREQREPRQAEVDTSVNALPAFITTPVRIPPEQPAPVPMSEPIVPIAQETAPALVPDAPGEDAAFPVRPRRRRRTKAEFAGADGETSHEVATPDAAGD